MRPNITLILFLLVIVAGVYVLPSAMAKFAGTHTMEFNQTGGVKTLECRDCHQYIFDELNATDRSREVLQVHKNAAANDTYTVNYFNFNISDETTDLATCQLCHLSNRTITSHTFTVVRACTDIYCHGNNETSNSTYAPNIRAANVGPNLSAKNVHEDWFDGMSGYNSTRVNESNINYTKGYWACLGCHTNVEVSMNVTKATYDHNDSSWNQGNPLRYM